MAVIEIDTIEKLVAFSGGEYGRGTSGEYLDVVLTADLDFADMNEYDSPYNWAGCTGTWYINFDGQGHKVDNIYYSGTADWGFFGTIYGSVKNLYLPNMFVTSTRIVAGCVINLYGTLENVHVSGYLENLSTNNDLACCGLYFYASGSITRMCSVSGILKGGSACGLGRNSSGTRSLIANCMVNADMTSIGAANQCALVAFASVNTTVVNCEYKGIAVAGRLLTGGWDEFISNCILIYKPGTTAQNWVSNSTYYNVYYDSTLAAEGGFTPPGAVTGAPTTDLQDGQWLHEHGFAI